ncbi:hypothetical protein [Bdellovibrio sp. HCB274]|uniref:hypothetical protein n=1 Tax=Bdellovibrio sp. HCB274 TaxID=3394361 RepID=UPI0039B3D06B
MSRNGKYQLIIPVILMLGAWWFHQSTQSTPTEKALALKPQTNTAGANVLVATPQDISQKPTHIAAKNESAFVAPTAVTNSNFSPRLERHVNYIALLLNRPDVAIPSQALATAHLTSEEMSQLGNAVINQQTDATTRQASIFILSKSGPKAIPALGMIAASNFKESSAQTEVPLRITALESLDKMTGNSADVLKALRTTIDKQSNKTLVFLATISAGGIKEGRPGKLSRAMDQMIKEKNL